MNSYFYRIALRADRHQLLPQIRKVRPLPHLASWAFDAFGEQSVTGCPGHPAPAKQSLTLADDLGEIVNALAHTPVALLRLRRPRRLRLSSKSKSKAMANSEPEMAA
jgi:hypothetical protein